MVLGVWRGFGGGRGGFEGLEGLGLGLEVKKWIFFQLKEGFQELEKEKKAGSQEELGV